MTDVPVSQEAREAAADLKAGDRGAIAVHEAVIIDGMRKGLLDRCATVQAFAKFEQSIRQQAERDALARMERREVAARYQHKKRGSVYEVLGEAELQCAVMSPIEGDLLTIYRGTDGKWWARFRDEFYDGRFEPLPTPPAGEA